MTAIKNGTLLVKDSNGNTARVATLSQTDITTLNTALADIEANKRKISSISANYVTTNTQQNITRKKIFANQEYPLEIRDDRYDNSVTPTTRIHNSIILYDKNNKGVGMLQFEHGPSGHHLVRISAIAQNADGNNIYAPLTVGIKSDGTTSTSAPSPASNSNDSSIATTAWVNHKVDSIGSNYVTTNTAQTITGKKTLSTTNKAEVIAVKVTNTDNTVTPTEDLWTNVISCYDKNHINDGNLQFARYPNGSNWISLQPVNKNSSGNTVYTSIGVGIGSDGTASTYAPNPASNSNDTSIATTAWVKSKMLDFIYPVGSIYMSVNNVSPQTFLGGTWVALQDRFLIGAGHSYAVNATGGATTHTLTVNEMPSHTHTFQGASIGNHAHTIYSTFHLDNYVGGGGSYMDFIRPMAGAQNTISSVAGASGVSGSIAASGGNQAHSIMNPYLAVYMWKRTA